MTTVISIHSYRGGTGKSNTTANLGVLFAARGLNVAIIDTDIYSPGVHILFGLDDQNTAFTLNDYLQGACSIRQAAHNVGERLSQTLSGKLYLVPASIESGQITKILREGYDVGLLNDGLTELIQELNIDVLLIDTHPGLNDETLLSLAISDALVIVLRPDQQDFQGTSVTVEVARRLDVPKIVMLLNKVPAALDLAALRQRVEERYEVPVVAALPHADDLMLLGSAGIFVLQFPEHVVTAGLRQLSLALIS